MVTGLLAAVVVVNLVHIWTMWRRIRWYRQEVRRIDALMDARR